MRSVPATLGRYEIGRLLGAGASGEVYLASLHGAMGFQKRFALKVFADDRPDADPRQLGQFINEGMLGEHLQHPNIVSVVEFGEADGRFFLVMEFIDGISLRGVIELCAGRGVVLPEEVVCELGVQVCAGLDHAHCATGRDGAPLQLVHRDLKPANLILDGTGTVRILDFGVARVATSPYYTTAMGEIRGTPAYMAPEQVRATDTPTASLDTYTLGLVLCEAATGSPVFVDHAIDQLLRKVLTADTSAALQQLGERAPGLLPIVSRALSPGLDGRYRTTAEMGEDLRQRWLACGGRARLGQVAQATLGLRPDGDAAGTPGAGARRGEPTLAVPAVAEEPATGPVTWGRFMRAFVDQLGETGVATDGVTTHPAGGPAPPADRPVRRFPGWWVAVALVVVALLVPAVGIPLFRAFDSGDGPLAEVVSGGGAAPAEVGPAPAEEDPAPTVTEPATGSGPAAGEPAESVVSEVPTPGEAPTPAPPTPTPAPPTTTGWFQVNSRPWSQVWVDGDRVGTTGTPSFQIAAGPHSVLLIQPSSDARKQFDVEIPADATVNLGCWDFRAETRCGE